MQRRQFLGAAAALGGLSADSEPAELESGGNLRRHVEKQNVGRFSGGITADTGGEATVHVSAHPHQRSIPVALELSMDCLNMSAALEPAEAREAAQALLDAAEYVEQWREANDA